MSVVNETDDENRETKFIEVIMGTTFAINGNINYVSHDMYGNMYKSNFPRLLDGENTITITGSVTSITFEFNNRRML